MIIAKNLTKTFYAETNPHSPQMGIASADTGIIAVKNISLHIKKGETIGLLGANGAGKTTLIRLICGLLTPTEGFLRVFGEDPTFRKPGKINRIGLLSGQQITDSLQKRTGAGGNLPDADYSLERNLELLGAIYRIPKKICRQRIQDLTEILGIADTLHYRAHQLSLGQRMRAELAAVLLFEPSLLILDEPFVGIDTAAREKLRTLLSSYAGHPETTVILTTHNPAEAEKICDRLLIMDKGALTYNGSMESLKKSRIGLHILKAVFTDAMPDLADLPIDRYTIENNTLTLEYDPTVIGTPELTRYLLSHGSIKDLLIREPGLEDIIRRLHTKGGIPYEHNTPGDHSGKRSSENI